MATNLTGEDLKAIKKVVVEVVDERVERAEERLAQATDAAFRRTDKRLGRLETKLEKKADKTDLAKKADKSDLDRFATKYDVQDAVSDAKDEIIEHMNTQYEPRLARVEKRV